MNNYIEDVFEESISFDCGQGTVFTHSYTENGATISLQQLAGTQVLQAKVVRVEKLKNTANPATENIDKPLRLYFQLADGWQFLKDGFNAGDGSSRSPGNEQNLIRNRNGMLKYFNFIFDAYLNSGQVYCTFLEGGETVFSHQPAIVGNSFRIVAAARTEDVEIYPKDPILINDVNYEHGYIDLEYFPERISTVDVQPSHPGYLPEHYKNGQDPATGKQVARLASQLRIGTDQLAGAKIAMQFIFGYNVIQGNQVYFNEQRTARFQHDDNLRNETFVSNNGQKDLNMNRRRWRFYHDFGQDANGILLYGSCHYNIVSNNITHGARIGVMALGVDALGKDSNNALWLMPANIAYAPCNFNLLVNNIVTKANIYCLSFLGEGFYPYPDVYEEANPVNNLRYPLHPVYSRQAGQIYRDDISDRYFFNIGNQLHNNVLSFGEYRLSWQKQFQLNSQELFNPNKPLVRFRETMLLLYSLFQGATPIPAFPGHEQYPAFYLWVDNLAILVANQPPNNPNLPAALQNISSTINP